MLDNTNTEPDFDNLIQQLREAHRYIGDGPYSEKEDLFNRISDEFLVLLHDWMQTFRQMAYEADDEDTLMRWSRTAWRISKAWVMLTAAKNVTS